MQKRRRRHVDDQFASHVPRRIKQRDTQHHTKRQHDDTPSFINRMSTFTLIVMHESSRTWSRVAS